MSKGRRRPESVLRSLGLRVRELRRAMGLTQAQAAEKLRMQVANYANIEQGKRNVTVHTLVRLADFYKVPMGALFDAPTQTKVRPGRPRKTD